VAIEAADIVLVSADLRGVPAAIRLARATLSTIRQNLAWALGYNVLLIPLAAGVFSAWGWGLPPAAAAAAMAASSVSVVANSLWLARRKV
jgi:P-type E1-E2 ATPase